MQQGILTYPAYLENATRNLTSRGATVIISSPTPNNPWETGSFVYTPNRFTTYSHDSAAEFEEATFVDHGQLLANAYEELGAAEVDSFYPIDHTHTSPEGADVAAQTFVRGLLCSESDLKGYVVNSTDSVIGNCL